MAARCLGCKEELGSGAYIQVAAGLMHAECFVCPCCGKNLANAKGYLPYKGNTVCSVACRAAAVRDPSLLLQTSKHWRQVQGGTTTWAASSS